MIIVYNSRTGNTKEYALMLSEMTGIKAIPFSEYRKSDEKIIFMSYIYANRLGGYKKIINKAKIFLICACGINNKSEINTKNLIMQNGINKPFFYLRGGLNPEKAKGIQKFVIKSVIASILKDNKIEDMDIIDSINNQKSFVNKDYLFPVIEFINNPTIKKPKVLFTGKNSVVPYLIAKNQISDLVDLYFYDSGFDSLDNLSFYNNLKNNLEIKEETIESTKSFDDINIDYCISFNDSENADDIIAIYRYVFDLKLGNLNSDSLLNAIEIIKSKIEILKNKVIANMDK